VLKHAKDTSNRNSRNTFNPPPSSDFLDGLFSSNQVSSSGDDDEESQGEDGNEEDWDDNSYFTNLKGNSYCESPTLSKDDEEQGCQVEKDSGEPGQEGDEGDEQDEDLNDPNVYDDPNIYEDAAEENSPAQRKHKAIREQDSQHRKVKVHLDNEVCAVFLSSCPLIS
jgi:hypothetical protein